MTALPVPFVSQIDPVSGSGQANCGPACIAQLLAYRGIIAPTRGAMLFLADIVRDGVPDNLGQFAGTYTTFAQLVACAGWFDVACWWFRSWADVHACLAAGEPVILLVDNTALWPRQYPRGGGFDGHHFVVLTGYTAPAPTASADAASDTFTVNDPLSVYARGPAPYTAASLVAATTLVGGITAIGFVPLTPAPVEEDMGIIAELSKQVADLRAEIVGLNGQGDERERQIASLRQEIAGKDSTIGALTHDKLEPLEARLAEMHEQLQAAILALTSAQHPRRVEVIMEDATRVAFVPAA